MRKKLYVGMVLAAIVAAIGMVAGERWLNRGIAQDPPKAADAKKEPNLADLLKKDLDAKKEATPPPLPAPTDLDKLPPLSIPAPTPVKDEPKATKPPVVDQIPLPPPLADKPQTAEPKLDPPPAVKQKAADPVFPPLKKDDVKPPPLAPMPTAPPIPPTTTQTTKPDAPPPPSKPIAPPSAYSPAPMIADQVAKLKDCRWSLQVDVVDGRTLVVATVNKRHEFKIACQDLDLQTGKGTLVATGKVEINGEALAASCGRLEILLTDDRLVLESGVTVSIQKNATNVSDGRSAIELTGGNLKLRVSDIVPSKLTQAIWQQGDPAPARQAVDVPTVDSKKWTPYGKLMRSESKVAPALHLQNRAGEVIAYLEVRAGGSLDQYIGQNISVFGTTEDHLQKTPIIRVTHIALP